VTVPRAVSMRHTVVPSADREDFRTRARESRAHYAKSGCRYWLYEEGQMPGAYVEFFEATDRETLARAHKSAHGAEHQSTRVYLEVELS
jgi:hypothetical protein